MEFNDGDIIEFTEKGIKCYITENAMNYDNYLLYPKYFKVINRGIYAVMLHCTDLNSKNTYFFNKKYLQISKSYYRKQKLKQIRNEI